MPKVTKTQRVREFVAARGWKVIGESEWQELRAALPDVSDATLRAAGIPIDAPWCGVNAHSLDELEQCLREFARVYEQRADLRRYCRDQVIAAKDRARWASKREAKRVIKTEMAEWMLIWLDDPSLFPAWIGLRRQHMG